MNVILCECIKQMVCSYSLPNPVVDSKEMPINMAAGKRSQLPHFFLVGHYASLTSCGVDACDYHGYSV